MKRTGKENVQDILTLTPMQQGMLFDYLKSPGSSRYVEQLRLRLQGKIDRQWCEKAWNWVIENNEMLRTAFRWHKVKTPVQLILKKHKADLRYFDLHGREDEEKELSRIIADDRNAGFDLTDVPFRVTLCRLSADKALMIVTNHHILYDGWSNGLLLKEFFKGYNIIAAGGTPTGIKKTPFKEFIKWGLEKTDQKREETFWKMYLSEHEGPKTRNLRPEVRNIGEYRFMLSEEQTARIPDFVKDLQITMSTFFTGAWGLLLQQYNNLKDIHFFTTVSGRNIKIKGIEDMVGMFINTLPIRVDGRENETIAQQLKRLYDESLQRETYENTSPAQLNEYLEKSGRRTLFDSVLVLENYPLDQQLMMKESVITVESHTATGMTRFDITLLITLFGNTTIHVTYNKDLFDQTFMDRLAECFINIMEHMLNHPNQDTATIDVLSENERMNLVEKIQRLNETVEADVTTYTAPRTEVELSLAQVWADVLNLDEGEIGIDHDFFDFGGHSLKATLLAGGVQRRLGVKIPLEEVFKNPTIRQMAKYIDGDAVAEEYEIIPTAPVKEYYPLSSAQHRMYSLQLLEPSSTAYNVSSVLSIEGKTDETFGKRVEAVFSKLIQRHEILRTSFHMIDGVPVQRIHDSVPFSLEYRREEGREPDEVIGGLIRSFELSMAPLLRIFLVRITSQRHLLIADMHHIITDGFGMNALIEEFSALYSGDDSPMPEKQYKDFAQWQYDRLQTGKLESQEKYWLDRFEGPLPTAEILSDFPRSQVQRFEGERVFFTLDDELSERLERFGRSMGTTPFMVFLSAFYVFMQRYTGQEDIIIGTTTAGRNHPDVSNMPGLFIETLAIRNELTGNKTFESFLKEVKTHTLAAYENQDYPFRELVRKKSDVRETGHNPIFNVMFILQNVDMAELKLGDLEVTPYPYYSKQSKLDMTLEAVKIDGNYHFHIEYATALFKAETIERMSRHFINILKRVVANPNLRPAEIDFSDQIEKQRLLEDFRRRNESFDYPAGSRIEQLIAETAQKMPNGTAVIDKYGEHSYASLDGKSNLLAKIIKEL